MIVEICLELDVEFIVFYEDLYSDIFEQNGYVSVGNAEEYTVYQRLV